VPVRAEVVRRKLATIREAVERLRPRASIGVEELQQDGLLQWAVERGFQVAAEALFDAGNHVLAGDFSDAADEYGQIPARLAAHRWARRARPSYSADAARRPSGSAGSTLAGGRAVSNPPNRSRSRPSRAGSHRPRSSNSEYATGVMRSVMSSESACPPMMTRAIEPREPEPGPRPSAIGTMPNTSMTVVIRIGRRRTRFASRMAASRGMPRPRSVFV